jgi:hypothetical protein
MLNSDTIDFSLIKQAKYIKLGTSGGLERECFQGDYIWLDNREIPHDLVIERDFVKLKRFIEEARKKNEFLTKKVRQVIQFYDAGPETLWITFTDGLLWWAVASKNVEYIESDSKTFSYGTRFKKVLTPGWKCTSLAGEQLYMNSLSGKLTKTAFFLGTLCQIKSGAFEYLLSKIQDKETRLIKETKTMQKNLIILARKLLQELTWSDFELLVDLIFTNAGWLRQSRVGGKQKSIDMIYINRISKETAIVQVKSATNQSTLDKCLIDLQKFNAEHIFYVYHTSVGQLNSYQRTVHLLGPDELAEKVVNDGFIEWLIKITC